MMSARIKVMCAAALALCFFAAITAANAHTARVPGIACVPYQGSPATAGKCDYIVPVAAHSKPVNIFLQGKTYEEVDAQAGAATRFLGAFVPYECRNALLALTCMGSFLHCEIDATSGVSVYPPCQSACQHAHKVCAQFLASAGNSQLLPNCSATDNSTGQVVPVFPPDGLAPCSSVPFNTSVAYSQVDCPYPLKYNYDGEAKFADNDYNGQDICLYPCPDPQWSDSEWEAGVVVMMVLLGISVFISVMMVIALALMPTKRIYPASNFLCMFICATGVSGTIFFFHLVTGGPTSTVCTQGNPQLTVTWDNSSDHNAGGVPCILQGVLLLYWALCSNNWWFALCINVFEMLYLQRSVAVIRRYYWVYHVLAWGLPVIAVAIGLGGHAFGSFGAVPYCFVAGNEWWTWGLFYIPVALTLITGFILMALGLFRLIKVRFRLRGTVSTSQTVEQVIRLVTVAMTYFFLLLFPWFFRVYTRAVESDIADAVAEQIACSAATGTECPLSERINIGMFYLIIFDISSPGQVLFISLFSSEVWYFWSYVNKLFYTRPLGEAIHITGLMIQGKDDGAWNPKNQNGTSPINPKGMQSAETKSAGSASLDDDL